MYTCDLFFNNQYKVKYSTDMQTEFDWTIHYLKPYFSQNSSCCYVDTYSVTSEYNPSKYAVIMNMLEGVSTKTVSDHHSKLSHQYIDKFGATYYQKENLIVVKENSLCYSVIKNSPDYTYCFESARIIREIMTYEMAKRGFAKIHCSAVQRDGEAIVFIGDKGAGKTTKMINLVSHGFNFITNDRAFIGFKDNVPYVYSWPGAVSVSIDTLSMFDEFSGVLEKKNSFRFPQWRLEVDGQEYSGKFDFTPVEFCDLFDVSATSCSRIKKIICISEKKEIVDIEENILRKNIFFDKDVSYPDWLNLLGTCKFDVINFTKRIRPFLFPIIMPRAELETEYKTIMRNINIS